MEATANDDTEGRITYSSFNIGRIPPRIRTTYFGKIRTFNTFTVLECVYLAIALIALTISLGITIQKLTMINANERDFTFALLLLLTTVFCYMYVIHSMFTERWDELMVFVVCNIIVLACCIVNYETGERNALKLARLICIIVCSPFLIGVGVSLFLRYFRSNNLIFNTVGASSSLQNSCQMYYICSSLLKFDLQLQLSMLILVVGKAEVLLFGKLEQKIILVSGIPVTFLFIIVGFLGLCYENKSLMILFYILSLSEPSYIAYKFHYIVTTKSNIDAVYISTFVCGSFALVVWLLLIFSTTYFQFYHFGKGLKEKMLEDKGSLQQTGSYTTSHNESTYILTPSLTGIQSA